MRGKQALSRAQSSPVQGNDILQSLLDNIERIKMWSFYCKYMLWALKISFPPKILGFLRPVCNELLTD